MEIHTSALEIFSHQGGDMDEAMGRLYFEKKKHDVLHIIFLNTRKKNIFFSKNSNLHVLEKIQK